MGKLQIIISITLIVIVIAMTSLALNLILMKNQIQISKIFIDGENVVITKDTAAALDEIYSKNLNTEVPVCLAGEINSEGISIVGIERAEIVTATARNVTYVACPVYISTTTGVFKTIGSLHNHINEVCSLSDQDIETYAHDIERGQVVIGLYCGKYVFFILAELEGKIGEI